jgi:drug/metabolite transporter (DMT)-like permease
VPTGLLLGLSASLTWGFVDVCAAIATRRIGSLRMLVGSQLASLVVLGLVVIADPSLLGPTPLEGIEAGLPLGILSSVAYLSYFTALRIGPISIVSPVIVAYGGATVLLAVLLRGETLAPMQALGAICATAGVVLAGTTFHGGALRGARIVGPGVLVALLTLVLFAILTVALAGPIQAHGWLGVVLGSRLSNNVTSILMLVIAERSGASRFRPLLRPAGALTRSVIAVVAIGGALDMVAFVAYAVGLEVAPTWLVGLASSFGPIVVIAYAVSRLGERPHATQWMGLLLIGAGVGILSVVG